MLVVCDEVNIIIKLNYFKVIFIWCYFCFVMVDKDFIYELAIFNEVIIYVDIVCRVIFV